MAGEKLLDAAVIVDALGNVSNHFGIEKTDRQLHQLDQEIRYNGNIDTAVHVY